MDDDEFYELLDQAERLDEIIGRARSGHTRRSPGGGKSVESGNVTVIVQPGSDTGGGSGIIRAAFVLLVLMVIGFGVGQFYPYIQKLIGNPPSVGTTGVEVGPDGSTVLKSPPSMSAEKIEQLLVRAGSPAVGKGQVVFDLGVKYGINPAIAIAFFRQESSFQTDQNGYPAGKSWGNIICAGYKTCYGRFRTYSTWEESIEDWYRLIDVEYIQGRGHRTVRDVLPVYAPSFENDTEGYTNNVDRWVACWSSDTPIEQCP